MPRCQIHNQNIIALTSYPKPTNVVSIRRFVESFDTSNHVLIFKVLKRYGCPPNLRSAIERMYKNSIVRLKIGKADITIPFEVGVKQGDSMAPVLFIFLITGFTETLEKEWEKKRTA